jgi:LysR family transcriptional regulator, cell division regulator
LDARDLKVFEAVAKHGGMNRAAASLNTVQSNVTARIRALEEELGAALFRRHGRGVSLTHAGNRLLPYAAKIKSLLDEARRAVSEDGVPKGLLAIGSLETTAAQRLSPIIAAFGMSYPEVRLTLRAGTNAAILEKVIEHELDGAFVCAPVTHPDLIGETVFHEELVLATAPHAASLDALLGSNCRLLVKGPGCAYRDCLERLLERRGVRGFDYLEFGTLDAIVGCVAAGLGLTLLPRIVLVGAEKEGRVRLHTLPAEEAMVETVFVRRRDVFEFGAMKAFIETFRSMAAS